MSNSKPNNIENQKINNINKNEDKENEENMKKIESTIKDFIKKVRFETERSEMKKTNMKMKV